MARFYPHYHGKIGYSIKERGPRLGVAFLDPAGRRLERMTRFEKADENFHEEARRIIDEVYAGSSARQSIGWDDAMKELSQTASDLSPKTLEGYRKVVAALRRTLDPCPESPAEITPDLATRFCRLFASGTYSRSNAEGSTQRTRKPTSLRSYLGQLQAVWHHLKLLALVPLNPWRDVRRPKVDDVVKPTPTEEEVTAFFWWIQKRYPTWRRLHALLDLKAFTGCRTNDIAQLRSDQLRGGCVVWCQRAPKPSQ